MRPNKMSFSGFVFSLALGPLMLVSAAQAVDRFVATTGSPTATGLGSFANASSDLQAMITASSPTDRVWVAMGVYKPTVGTGRAKTFTLVDGVRVYGGFVWPFGTVTIY